MLKTLLKTARQALSDKDNTYCITQCENALEIDSKSYNAHVFLALAHTNLAHYEDGVKYYEEAIRLEESNLLAWQGLLGLYEKSSQVSKYLDVASRIAAIYSEQSDSEKCLSVILKTVEFARSYATQSELAQALRLILPVSPFFRSLEDSLPNPVDTYEEVAQILEREESSSISSAIAKGRSRLGVRLDQLTTDVKRSVYETSQLESIYEEIINWSHEEKVRRNAENKLLARAFAKLSVSPTDKKNEQLQRVLDVARGMTIVKVPNYLAWSIMMDWTDTDLSQLDLQFLLTFISLFPERTFSAALKLYLRCSVSPFSSEDLQKFEGDYQNSTGSRHSTHPELSDVLLRLGDAFEDEGESGMLMCGRFMLQIMYFENDWRNVLDLSETLLKRLNSLERMTTLKLTSTRNQIELQLATALMYHRSPKFHEKSFELFGGLVARATSPTRSQAMIGQAQILRMDGKFEDSAILLAQVLKLAPHNEEALLELAKCHFSVSKYDEALTILEDLGDRLQHSGRREMLASIYYIIGECQRLSSFATGSVYRAYIQSLKFDANYAPTYTALGKHYADNIGDHRRAEKCFQRALELSSAEITAAERLAATFASDGDWELVEIIAQRVIQGNERIQISWPHRAIGFVQLHAGHHQQAISAFQAGLRLTTTDVNAWIGLGESYLELGRYQAAEKAFMRATMLDSKNWFAKYLLATVWTAVGEHSRAVASLESLVAEDQNALSLRLSLSAAYIAWGRALLEAGQISKASQTLHKCLNLIDNMEIAVAPYTKANLLGRAARLLAECKCSEDIENIELLERLEEICSPSALVSHLPIPSASLQGASRHAFLSANAFAFCTEDTELQKANEAVLWYDVGRSLSLVLPYSQESEQFQVASTAAFQCAVKLDPLNDIFWSALGTSVASTDYGFAQHCLIKAVSIDDRSSMHWTNLGYLYLKLNHMEAANLAFMNAQSRDPSAAMAWFGQACISQSIGESDHELFEHAYRLNDSVQSPVIALKFAHSVSGQKPFVASNQSDLLVDSLWALAQAEKGSTSMAQKLTCSYTKALLLEQTEDIDQLQLICTDLVTTLEEQYEDNESLETLGKYCDAKALQARILLRSKDYEAAVETASSVIDLEPNNAAESVSSCRVVLGIGKYYLADEEGAITSLQELYEDSNNDSIYLRCLVQILASSTDKNSNVIALDLLEDQDSASLRLLLAAIVAVQKVEGKKYQALARSALLVLLSHDTHRDARDKVEYILETPKSIDQGQIHAYPESSVKSWLRLARSMKHTESRKQLMDIALIAAEQSHDMDDIAMVCHSSDEPHLCAVGLHISPTK